MCRNNLDINLKLYLCLFVLVSRLKAPGRNSRMSRSTIWHTHTPMYTSTHTIYSPVDLQIVFAAKSNWCFSKAPLSIFPVSVFFIILSRYFPWWLACCRWERAIVCLDNELTPSSFFPAKHSINSSNISVLPSLRLCILDRLGADA